MTDISHIPKVWKEYPDTTDPATAAAVMDMEQRLVAQRTDGLGLRIGRQWHTNFGSSGYDNALFDITNFTRGTDSGVNALTQTTAGTEAACWLKTGQNLRNLEMRLRYRTTATPHTSSFVSLYGRYLDASNNWQVRRGWNGAIDGPMEVLSPSLGTALGPTISIATSDFTATTSRVLRCRIVDDVILIKDYVEGSGLEPDWQWTRQLRPGDNVVENVEIGIAGFTVNAAAAGSLFVAFDFTVTELLRTDVSLIANGSAQLRDDATGKPIYWDVTTQDSGNSVSIVSATGPFGGTRNVFQLVQAATYTGGNVVMWRQSIWSALHFGPSGFGARQRRVPAGVFGPTLEVSVWTKGTAITRPFGGSIFAAGFVLYYSDNFDPPNGLNISDPNYFHPFGPNASGEGTWDWTLNRWLIPLNQWQRVYNALASVGFHDDSRGTLQFCDLSLRVVP
jgi:hypothetical protein